MSLGRSMAVSWRSAATRVPPRRSWPAVVSGSISSRSGRSSLPLRERYVEQWAAAQRNFVDEPVGAVGHAHELVQRVMHDRGYPVEKDFAQRTADISVEHPAVVENYRAAHEISVRARDGKAGTEELRQAMVHFRALFDDLLAPSDTGHADRASDPERARENAGVGAVSQQTTPRR